MWRATPIYKLKQATEKRSSIQRQLRVAGNHQTTGYRQGWSWNKWRIQLGSKVVGGQGRPIMSRKITATNTHAYLIILPVLVPCTKWRNTEICSQKSARKVSNRISALTTYPVRPDDTVAVYAFLEDLSYCNRHPIRSEADSVVEDLLLMLSTAMQGYWVECNQNQMPDSHIFFLGILFI